MELKRLNEYKEFLEEKGYEVLYVGLYGSQNYNLQDETSDIDARAIVLNKFEDLLHNKKISKTYDFGDDGLIDVKDVMSYYEVSQKGNPAFLECMQTEYWIGDEKIREIMDAPINPKAVKGMMYQKLNEIKKGNPKHSPTIPTHGYDTKQLLHIIRLAYLLQSNTDKSYLYHDDAVRKELLDIKTGVTAPDNPEDAFRLAQDYINSILEIADSREVVKANKDAMVTEYLKSKYTELLSREN